MVIVSLSRVVYGYSFVVAGCLWLWFRCRVVSMVMVLLAMVVIVSCVYIPFFPRISKVADVESLREFAVVVGVRGFMVFTESRK